ncbi:MAG: DUF362 domain-containing protein [Elusimicrobiota bacterium]
MPITRRRFIKLALSSAAAGLAPAIPSRLWAAEPTPAAYPDLVAVRDGSPVRMFETGIQALGGLSRFVRKGQTVLVKPNIGWDKTPTEGANTNPELVGRIVKAAYEAGAKKVYCFDHGVNKEKACHKRSGIAAAVEANGGEMRSADKKSHYREVKLDGEVLKNVLVHKLYLDSDVVINVPILKSHGGGRVTASIKNLMGVVWDRRFWHRHGLHQAIGEFMQVRKPDLNVLDAYLVMVNNGPRGVSTDDLLLKKMQLLSPDPVLADTAGAKVLDVPPENVKYLGIAQGLKLGTMDLKGSDIKRISLET